MILCKDKLWNDNEGSKNGWALTRTNLSAERSEQLTDFVYGTNGLRGLAWPASRPLPGRNIPSISEALVLVFLVCSFQQYSSTVYAARASQARA